MQVRLALAALLLGAACGTSMPELDEAGRPLEAVPEREAIQAQQREEARWLDEREAICFLKSPVRLYLFNNMYPVDAPRQFQFPRLQHDFFRKMVEHSTLSRSDAELTATLLGPVNDAFNSRLEETNSGRYNTVYALVGRHRAGSPLEFFSPDFRYIGITPVFRNVHGQSLTVTPADRDGAVVVWVSAHFHEDRLRRLFPVPDDNHEDLLMAFDPAGNLLTVRDRTLPIRLEDPSRFFFYDYVKFPQTTDSHFSVVGYPLKCTSTWNPRFEPR